MNTKYLKVEYLTFIKCLFLYSRWRVDCYRFIRIKERHFFNARLVIHEVKRPNNHLILFKGTFSDGGVQ